jgi:hypothetical protein
VNTVQTGQAEQPAEEDDDTDDDHYGSNQRGNLAWRWTDRIVAGRIHGKVRIILSDFHRRTMLSESFVDSVNDIASTGVKPIDFLVLGTEWPERALPRAQLMNSLLADAVLLAHVAFVLFVAFGGVLVLRWPRAAWAHIPAALWGIAIEFGGWICPLTPLENALRTRAGESPYQGDFIARYLMPVLYPEGLTREAQVTIGAAALVTNAVLYAIAWRRHVRRRA